MKLLVVVLAVCVASSFADTINDNQKAQLAEYKAACISETGVDPVVVENAKKGTIAEGDAKFACFTSCFMKKLGFLNADGQFDETVFRSKVPANISKEKVDAIVDKCKSLTGADACETGFKLYKCYVENKTVSILAS